MSAVDAAHNECRSRLRDMRARLQAIDAHVAQIWRIRRLGNADTAASALVLRKSAEDMIDAMRLDLVHLQGALLQLAEGFDARGGGKEGSA